MQGDSADALMRTLIIARASNATRSVGGDRIARLHPIHNNESGY
jgi:hypothetical protein